MMEIPDEDEDHVLDGADTVAQPYPTDHVLNIGFGTLFSVQF